MKLAHPPVDCISRVRFAPNAVSRQLLVSSWDAHVRLYDVDAGRLTGLHKQSLAVLDCTYLEDTNQAVSVGLEKRVVYWDFVGQGETTIGVHDEAIRCVEYHHPTKQVFTGSWDRTARSWDPRQGARATNVLQLHTKVFCLDVSGDHLVVGGSDRHIHIFDLRRVGQGSIERLEKRESSLRHQIRALKIGIDGRAYASGSVEGRVGLEYFEHEENQKLRYAFKCHRVKDGGGAEVVHPVNAITFHPVHGTFATGGSDGGVCVWDAHAKKRLWRLSPFETSVSSLCFSSDGTLLAMGVSYTFDQGEIMPPPPIELSIRAITDAEVRPKGKGER